jgi:CheY-like chemotaxis protein
LQPKQKEILCVCQDGLTLQVRQMLFEHFGYKVLTSDSIASVHTLLRQSCPDMLLLDTSDPELDWQALTDKAKAICPDILSVVLTSDYGRLHTSHESVDRFLRLDGPREEWLSGIASLFAGRGTRNTEASGAAI